jgi:ribosome-binding ATPase
MLIGLVGKPSCGKSTFFKAATMADVLIASYPFATIKPNQGVGYVKVECIEKEFDVKCNPSHGYCVNGMRFVPIDLVDVAGLVEGASEGKGLGNQFLDNLTSADALIHIVDISGETDAEGKVTKDYDPLKDVDMLESELDNWYLEILKKAWTSLSKSLQSSKENISRAIANQFSGLKVKEEDVKQVLLQLGFDSKRPSEWTDEQLKDFAHTLRHLTKPMILAANKIDRSNSEYNFERLKESFPEMTIIPCSAESELALREATNAGLINYIPGSEDFEIKGELNEKQEKAVDSIKEKVLDNYGSTGIQEVLNKTVFDLLKYLAIFPSSASKLADSKGNVLPDCFLLPPGSTALDFAYFLHTDFGDNFIKAINARTKQAVGKEYKLKNLDALEILTR